MRDAVAGGRGRSRIDGSRCSPRISTATTGGPRRSPAAATCCTWRRRFPPVAAEGPGRADRPGARRRPAGAARRAGRRRRARRHDVVGRGGPLRRGRSSESAPYTEADWTDGDDTSRTPYVRSKTIAEQAAWEHVRDAGARGSPRHDQSRRDHRPGAQRRPLLLAAGDPAAARRDAGAAHGSGSRSSTSATSPTCTSARSPTRRPAASASSRPIASCGWPRSRRSCASASAMRRRRSRRASRRTC